MTLFSKQRSIQKDCMLRCFNMISLGQYHCPVAVRLGTLERQTRPFFQREMRFNEVALNCRLFPQILRLRVVMYFIITEEINVLVLLHVYSSFNCLMPYVVAVVCDIHAMSSGLSYIIWTTLINISSLEERTTSMSSGYICITDSMETTAFSVRLLQHCTSVWHNPAEVIGQHFACQSPRLRIFA